MRPPPSLLVILNPAASGGRGGRMRGRVEAALRERGMEFILSPTDAPGHAAQITRAAREAGHERVLVVGGDGTVHEVANAILEEEDPRVAMAVAPVGTGNDFFGMVAPTRSLPKALDTLFGRVHHFEVGLARYDTGTSYFVNLLGVGLDVAILRRRASFKRLSGLPQYLAALFATLITYRPIPIRMSLNRGEEVLEGPTLLAGLTVGPSIGGGFLLSPDATPEDGLLDLFFVDPLGVGKVARYIPRVIRGTHKHVPEFHFRKVTQVAIRHPDGIPFYFELDGELMPDPTRRLEIEIRPGALPVLLAERGQAAG